MVNKVLDAIKLKALAGDKLNVAQNNFCCLLTESKTLLQMLVTSIVLFLHNIFKSGFCSVFEILSQRFSGFHEPDREGFENIVG